MLAAVVMAVSVASACSSSTKQGQPTVVTTAPTNSSITIAYGEDSSQFGQLWLPVGSELEPESNPVPLVILIHGGFWRSAYGLDLMDPLAADLASRGFAAWNIEYRRVGQRGGGYPGTLEDVASAVDMIATVADQYSIDLASTVVVGHSAGGHLALWTAGRSSLPVGAPGASPAVVPRLAIGQGPVFDLRAGDAGGLGGGAVSDFIGGSVAQFPQRYDIASPSTTSGVPLAVVRGADDDIVPERFTVPAAIGDVNADVGADRNGDVDGDVDGGVVVVDVPGDHFALIDPTTPAWQAVIDLIEA